MAQLKKKKQNVYVALSGGVDSAVAALKLVEGGHNVTGVFMKNWSGEEYGLEDTCPWKKDQTDAKSVCDHLGIPFKTYNFEKEYRKEIIQYFFDEYKRGNTPNPDILCNQQIKFGVFLKRALEDGADMIATGHYAQKGENNDGNYDLLRAADPTKDQTYFLYRITQEQLARSLFLLGMLKKTEVRNLAKENKLPVAEKPDSQGICFLGKIDVVEFLKKEIKPKAGDIVDIDTGAKVGEHQGVWFYTNGQREGLGIGGLDKPYFVADKDLKKNILFAAKGKENSKLHATGVKISNVHWINNLPGKEKVKGMVRYRQEPEECSIDETTITFSSPIWLPSTGQSAVLIKNETVLGGGIITEIERLSH